MASSVDRSGLIFFIFFFVDTKYFTTHLEGGAERYHSLQERGRQRGLESSQRV